MEGGEWLIYNSKSNIPAERFFVIFDVQGGGERMFSAFVIILKIIGVNLFL